MCDVAEEEFAEYLLWLEAARAPVKTPRPAKTKAATETIASAPTLVEVAA